MSPKKLVLIDCDRVTRATRGFRANYWYEGGFPPFTGIYIG